MTNRPGIMDFVSAAGSIGVCGCSVSSNWSNGIPANIQNAFVSMVPATRIDVPMKAVRRKR